MELRYSLDISQALDPPCQILLDAEIYDAGPSRSLTEGFKIAVIHQFDMAMMSQSGLNINTGSLTQAPSAAAAPNLIFRVLPQVGVRAKQMKTTPRARDRFSPEERGCFFKDEIKADC